MPAAAKKSLAPVPDNAAPGGKSLYYKNEGLFSDPYIDQLSSGGYSPAVQRHWESEGYQEFNETYEWMLSTWDELKEILPKLSEAQLEEKWIKPILQKLGWEYEVQDRMKKWGKTEIPDYSLFESRKSYLRAQKCKTDDAYFDHVLAVGDAKQWGVPLDGSKLDKSNPSFQIIWYQQITRRDWGILTDGKYWRLYSTRSKSRYTTYYEINVEKFLVERDDQKFKFFFNFFCRNAFVKNETTSQSFLDVVLESGEQYARAVETKLKDRAFHLVELIAKGLATNEGKLDDAHLEQVYRHSLYYLFRLMFILNCEAKGLLQVYRQAHYYPYSLRALCHKIREADENGQTWTNRCLSYNHVNELLELLRTGDERIGIHGFGKEMFSSGDPNFFRDHKIPDEYLNKVLLELAFSSDKKTDELHFIDYKRLSADHFGSVFEGLLEYRLECANGGRLPVLVNSNGERKATGSYYTPEYVVNYIVSQTLGPLVKDKSSSDILKLRIVDPAMGSGHFLLGAVRFLEDALMERLNEEREKEIDPGEVRWQILHTCIHGVDINPLAVELAKYSLWMYSARAGNKLEPLIDQMFQANSLDVEKVRSHFGLTRQNGNGFDAVVGNPPYVDYRELDEKTLKLAEGYQSTQTSEKWSLYVPFLELGCRLLAEDGRLGYIVPNQWLSANYGIQLRDMILEKYAILGILDVSSLKIFGDASTYPVLVFLKNAAMAKRDKFKVAVVEKPEELKSLDEIDTSMTKEKVINADSHRIALAANAALESIFEKFCDFQKLADVAENFKWGTSQAGYGKKKIDQSAYRELPEAKKKTYAKIIQTADIKPLHLEWQKEYIPVDIYVPAQRELFKEDKLVIARVTKRLQCCVDEDGHYLGKASFFTGTNIMLLKAMAVMLSSRLVSTWYHYRFQTVHMSGGYLRYDIPYLKEIPVPRMTELNTKALAKIYDSNTSELKQDEIDAVVERAYGLTKEESRLVRVYFEQKFPSKETEIKEAA